MEIVSFLKTYFSIFGSALVIFHVCAIAIKKSPVLWKVVDYVWVSLMVLGLAAIGLNFHIGKVAQKSADDLEMIAYFQEQLVADIDMYISWYHFRPEDWPEIKKQEYKEADQAFTRYRELVDGEGICERLEEIRAFAFPQWKKIRVDHTLEAVNEYLVGIEQVCSRHILQEEEAVFLRGSNIPFNFLGAWFLGIATAIRITKITASILRYA